MGTVTKIVDGESTGFDGSTVLVMTDGSIYRQTHYYYEYHYQYRPQATIIDDREVILPGIRCPVRVERLR
ncbi:hypothetical protein ROSMUCSMR3_03848 [Roseovarius mucosus]|uniref:Uncharacterized protein n=1 Tax=Roseovarius mucosus TaxID=215743 RepID=A0A1V0RUD4_9RHOB|nr:hypothetical protein ROSMUCSMR3_03848 [Roseovarius mucosus]